MSRALFAAISLLAVLVLPFASCAAGSSSQGGITGQQAGGQAKTPSAGAPAQTPASPGAGNQPAGAPAYSTGAATGFIEVRVTDAPPDKKEVTGILLTVSTIEVHLAGSGMGDERGDSDNSTAGENKTKTGKPDRGQGQQGSDNTSASENRTGTGKPEQQGQGGDSWIKIATVKGNSFDLLKVKGLEELFASGAAPAGKYTQVRLLIDSATVTFSDNTSETATIPGGDLKFVNPFDVAAGKTTVLTFDFDAEKSVNVTGSGKVMIKPVVKLDIKQK